MIFTDWISYVAVGLMVAVLIYAVFSIYLKNTRLIYCNGFPYCFRDLIAPINWIVCIRIGYY